jgi:hypothetical protein
MFFIHTDWNRLVIQQKLQAVPFELEYELLSVEFSKELTSTPKIKKRNGIPLVLSQ